MMHVIEVFRERGVAYVAWYGEPLQFPDGTWNWCTNIEVALDRVEEKTGPLLDGPQDPWLEVEDAIRWAVP
jgi:hypothetical protein